MKKQLITYYIIAFLAVLTPIVVSIFINSSASSHSSTLGDAFAFVTVLGCIAIALSGVIWGLISRYVLKTQGLIGVLGYVIAALIYCALLIFI